MIEFNLNDHVKVRLTPLGKAQHKQRHVDFWNRHRGLNPPPYTPPKEDADGWSTWQLWRLMEEFGPMVSIGFDPPMEMTIRISTKEDANEAG